MSEIGDIKRRAGITEMAVGVDPSNAMEEAADIIQLYKTWIEMYMPEEHRNELEQDMRFRGLDHDLVINNLGKAIRGDI